jgi:N-acetylmuramoyl-L-alanine amidase
VYLLLLLAGFSVQAWGATSVSVRDVRLWTAPDNTRIVFDLSHAVRYEVFRLHNPERIVVDLRHARLRTSLEKLALPDPVVNKVRHGRPEAGVLRVVLDVKENVRPRSFLLKPMQGKPYRLVVDLVRHASATNQSVTPPRQKHGLIIAVDAGHGGEDPGAIGHDGTQEKDVTLQVARELAARINARPGMTAVLTRDGDYFVPLKKRVALVRRAHADLMISIHADSVRNRRVKGGSVYTLSERGATPDKVAAALAAKENAADAVGGVMPNDEVEDPLVRDILGDMAKRDSLNTSQMLAESIIKQLHHAGPVKYDAPKRARFVVLGALEIPSVLVELDYISNSHQERLLKSRHHQKKLAEAIFEASVNFFSRMGMIHGDKRLHASAL